MVTCIRIHASIIERKPHGQSDRHFGKLRKQRSRIGGIWRRAAQCLDALGNNAFARYDLLLHLAERAQTIQYRAVDAFGGKCLKFDVTRTIKAVDRFQQPETRILQVVCKLGIDIVAPRVQLGSHDARKAQIMRHDAVAQLTIAIFLEHTPLQRHISVAGDHLLLQGAVHAAS